MRFKTTCLACMSDDKKHHFSKDEFSDTSYFFVLNDYYTNLNNFLDKDIFVEADVQNNRGYILECNKGHLSYGVLNIEIYELLYDRAVFSYEDSYYRETITNISASLERFHEFCIRLLLFYKNTDNNEFDITWKMVKSMSERQYGAFLFLYLNALNESPPKINKIDKKEWHQFRNLVVHNGYFPTKDSAKLALQYTTDYIQQVENKLKSLIGINIIREYKFAKYSEAYDEIETQLTQLQTENHKNLNIMNLTIRPYLQIIDNAILEVKISKFKEDNIMVYASR